MDLVAVRRRKIGERREIKGWARSDLNLGQLTTDPWSQTKNFAIERS